jgi:serine/threonine protein kinase
VPEAPQLDLQKDLIEKEVREGSDSLTALYQNRNVWIEWKSYTPDEVETETGFDYEVPQKAIKDISRLVTLLRAKDKPAEFRVPYCVGYVKDEQHNRLGLVYQLQGVTDKSVRLISITDCLKFSQAALKSRISAAKCLATSLLYLHATNWLHKSLTSSSILLIDGQMNRSLTQVFITNFEYARPDKNSATITGPSEDTEWAIYCHPDYIGRRDNFRKTYDMYSLGIILIELALWKPASEIFGIDDVLSNKSDTDPGEIEPNGIIEGAQDEFEPPSPSVQQEPKIERIRKIRQIRGWLLSDESAGGKPQYMEDVRSAMGDSYHNAVKACIGGVEYFNLPKEIDQTDPVIATLIQQAYLRLVVDVLDGISV